MYGEDESTNDYNNDSKLDQKTKVKYNSPIYNFFISFIIHICYLLIFLVFIYSIIIYNNQVFNSGVFDNIISTGGGFCSPFLERTYYKDKSEVDSKPKDTFTENEYSNISLFNLIKFDYIDTNINNNCDPETYKQDIDISVETGDHTYGYGLVSFKKKYVKYLYSFFGEYDINLSNFIYFINYKKKSYAYNDNLISYSGIRDWFVIDLFWVIIDLGIALPIMFSIDTIRKSLVYNIIIYNLIYKTLYKYTNEGLLLLILGFLYVYYPSLIVSLLIIFPCFITGITFFIVFIYNLFFQTYHYILYSVEILKKLMEITYDSYKNNGNISKLWNNIFWYGFFFCIRIIGTLLKIIIVFFMMINMYSGISSFVVPFFIAYTLIFLYIIIPTCFRGNTLKKDKNILDDIYSLVKEDSEKSSTESLTDSLKESSARDSLTGGVKGDMTDSSTESSGNLSQHDINVQESSNKHVINPVILPSNITENSNKINISDYVNDKEDYSLVNVWKGIVYQQRYIYILIVIIFLIDFVGAEIIDKVYSYLVAFGVFLIVLLFGYFFNLLICKPPPPKIIEPGEIEMTEITKQPDEQNGGGNFFTDFLLNKFKKFTSRKNEFFIDYINYFNKENPITILNKYNSYFKTSTCNRTINDMSYIQDIQFIIDTIISVKKDDDDDDNKIKEAIAIPVENKDDNVKLVDFTNIASDSASVTNPLDSPASSASPASATTSRTTSPSASRT